MNSLNWNPNGNRFSGNAFRDSRFLVIRLKPDNLARKQRSFIRRKSATSRSEENLCNEKFLKSKAFSWSLNLSYRPKYSRLFVRSCVNLCKISAWKLRAFNMEIISGYEFANIVLVLKSGLIFQYFAKNMLHKRIH